MTETNNQGGLSTYLRNGGFQLRYVFFMVSLVALIAGGLGYLIHQQRLEATDSVGELLGDEGVVLNDEESLEVLAQVDDKDRSTVWPMVRAGLGMIAVLTFFLLMMTHLVAGPLNKVSRFFDKMRDGYLGSVWPLRRNPMLSRFYASFHDMHSAVRARHGECNDAIGELLKAAEAAGLESDDGELGHRLQEHKARYQERSNALM